MSNLAERIEAYKATCRNADAKSGNDFQYRAAISTANRMLQSMIEDYGFEAISSHVLGK